MKTIISIACLLLVVGAVVGEARPKRSIILSAPVVTHSHVLASPAVVSTSVVHPQPHSTVVKTEQVHDGAHSSYHYSSEVRANPPVVHSHTAAAVAAAPAAVVSTVQHTVPTYAYGYGYYPANYAYHYSPYHYVVGK